MDILGYVRPDGQMGIRDHLAVIYTVECAKVVAAKIAQQFPGAQLFGRRTGCMASQPMFDKLVALGRHPNVGAALVVGLGCEYIEAEAVAAAIAASGKPAESVVITRSGGTLRSVERGCRLVKGMLQAMGQAPRAPMAPADLVVAMDCAGSDATSGLASNPAVGNAADRLVAAGATIYFLNVWQELLGLGSVLAERAVNERVADDLRRECRAVGNPTINLGNQRGGITTYREKAAGALSKGAPARSRGSSKRSSGRSNPVSTWRSLRRVRTRGIATPSAPCRWRPAAPTSSSRPRGWAP